ncbi:MAG: ATP-binding protein [Planctomycetia bacterium]|nr:ATP-binding protein [Planctomycetia bacterium]
MAESLLPHTADRLVRRLSVRYLLVLVAVAALVGLDQIVVQPLLQHLGEFAPVINVAGRQRMLSQKLTKASLAYQAAPTPEERERRRVELRSTLDQWVAGHRALLEGDVAIGIARIHTPEIDEQWHALQPHWQAMRDAARSLAELPATDAVGDTARLVAIVLEHERRYLPTMDGIVKLLEQAAARQVTRLRLCALSIDSAVILLLLGLGSFVVRPATRAIGSQVEQLEARVALRTEELDQANMALRREIAERERAEASQQHLAAQLAHASRITTMGHLTAGLAHELNQPLAAIANFAEASDVLLDQTNVDETRLREHARQIQQAALRAGQIVRGMRNFVQPQRGSRNPLDLNALVREVIEFCRPEMLRRQVECESTLTSAPLVVAADRIQVQQVLVNLLQNAMDALDASPVAERRIEVRTSEADGFAQVDVVDNGPGVAAELVDAMFQPFHTTKTNGLGIGLSISRSIVEQHLGRIWATSSVGAGAKFCFSLPCFHEYEHPRTETADSLCR